MKVLWFSNSPCGATAFLTGREVTTGGWLYALSRALQQQKDLELHIAFYWGKKRESFRYGNIVYHPIYRAALKSRLSGYLSRVFRQFGFSDDAGEVARCLRVIHEVKPDLIHVHGSEDNFGLVAGEKLNIPVVLSIQGILNPICNKFYAGFPKAEIKRKSSWKQSILMKGIISAESLFAHSAARERIICRCIKHYIGRTAWDKACSLALNPNRRYYQCNEILRAEFGQAEWCPRERRSAFRIVTTISSGVFKGLETILRAASVLHEDGFDFEWNLIGVSPEDSLIGLTKKIYHVDAAQLPVVFRGRMNAGDMVQLMLQSDLYVQASHIENSPNSLCEAMMLGMPCIASFAGGTSDILHDREEGLLVQDGEPYVLAGAIMESERNYSESVRMAQKARLHAQQRHSEHHVVQDMLNIYKQLIEHSA